jgi:hypothetical protein
MHINIDYANYEPEIGSLALGYCEERKEERKESVFWGT